MSALGTGQACAHLRVDYDPFNLGAGQWQPQWRCTLCRNEFVLVSIEAALAIRPCRARNREEIAERVCARWFDTLFESRDRIDAGNWKAGLRVADDLLLELLGQQPPPPEPEPVKLPLREARRGGEWVILDATDRVVARCEEHHYANQLAAAFNAGGEPK
jgi:hypothetical protein